VPHEAATPNRANNVYCLVPETLPNVRLLTRAHRIFHYLVPEAMPNLVLFCLCSVWSNAYAIGTIASRWDKCVYNVQRCKQGPNGTFFGPKGSDKGCTDYHINRMSVSAWGHNEVRSCKAIAV
jgi:hypothetical protein